MVLAPALRLTAPAWERNGGMQSQQTEGRNMNLHYWMIALAGVCAEYHSGQWSRGYRLYCMADRWLRAHGTRPSPGAGWDQFDDIPEVADYREAIIERFADSL